MFVSNWFARYQAVTCGLYDKRKHLCAYMQNGQRASSKALGTFTVDRKVGLNPSRLHESQAMSARCSKTRYTIATVGDICCKHP